MKYSLNIYGENDAIIKTYETNIVPWGVFVKAASLQETLKNKNIVEQMAAMGELLQTIFVGLTDEELYHADSNDVMNLFTQITGNGSKIGKNA